MSHLEEKMNLIIGAIAQDCPSLTDYKREYQFHDKRKWRFDFAWPRLRVAVECNGGTWKYGRHNRGSSIGGDYEKLNEAQVMGWKVLQFTGDQIDDARYVERVITKATIRPLRPAIKARLQAALFALNEHDCAVARRNIQEVIELL